MKRRSPEHRIRQASLKLAIAVRMTKEAREEIADALRDLSARKEKADAA
jgi:hypothetical protein